MRVLVSELLNELKGKEIAEQLQILASRFPNEVVFSTSFGLEDQAITYFIASNKLPVKVFTLDTGRIFPETYTTWSRTVEKYGLTISAYYPEALAVQEFVTQKGPNSFYE